MSQIYKSIAGGGGGGGTTQFTTDFQQNLSTPNGIAIPVAGNINIKGGDGITTYVDPDNGQNVFIKIQNSTVDTVVTSDAAGQTQVLSTIDCSAVGTYFITTQLSAFEATVPGGVGAQMYTTVISNGAIATVVDDTDSVDHRSASMVDVGFSVVGGLDTNARVTVVGIAGKTINWGGITVYVYIPAAP